jgi:hypothetical protein
VAIKLAAIYKANENESRGASEGGWFQDRSSFSDSGVAVGEFFAGAGVGVGGAMSTRVVSASCSASEVEGWVWASRSAGEGEKEAGEGRLRHAMKEMRVASAPRNMTAHGSWAVIRTVEWSDKEEEERGEGYVL